MRSIAVSVGRYCGFVALSLSSLATVAAADSNKTPLKSLAVAPEASLDAQRPPALPRTQPRQWLNNDDRLATLHAVHIALTSVSDGGGYVWQRGHGKLSAIIRPTVSFKDRNGSVCRHIIISLNSKSYSDHKEGIACRDKSGVWTLGS